MCLAGHVDDIIGFTFQYIKILAEKGVEEWIFDEVCKKTKSLFREAIQHGIKL